MKQIQSRKIKVNKLDVHYFTGGQGDPLLVIHGGGNSARSWIKNIEELAKNYTVYAPDLPGFGRSQSMDGDYFIPELVEFVNDFSHELGLKKFHLVGHSLGGGIALSYALKFPHKLKKLVLVSSMCMGREIALWVRFLSSCWASRGIGKMVLAVLKSVKWVVGKLFAPVEFVLPLSTFSLSLGRKITTIREQTTVLFHQLSEVMVPTLVVWGARDPILPVRQAYAAAELIPDCQIKVFADSGHSVYRDNIFEFSRLLQRFLG